MNSRVQDILQVTDELIRLIDLWISTLAKRGLQEQGLPSEVLLAVENAARICEVGDIPDQCRDLCVVAIPRLEEETRKYLDPDNPHVQPNGQPVPSWWGAARNVAKCRKESEIPEIPRLEPVSVLLAQGVSHNQIAFHIYGFRGQGPFVDAHGGADVGLIEKEAKEPGSVIKPGWIPPWSADHVRRRMEESDARIAGYDRLAAEKSTKGTGDPCDIAGMIRDGCDVQQIERAKGVGREDVVAEFNRLGVPVKDGPTYAPRIPMPAESIPKPKETAPATKRSHKAKPKAEKTAEEDDETTAEELTDPLTIEAIVSCAVESPSLGAPEIAAKLKDEGFKVRSADVSRVLAARKAS